MNLLRPAQHGAARRRTAVAGCLSATTTESWTDEFGQTGLRMTFEEELPGRGFAETPSLRCCGCSGGTRPCQTVAVPGAWRSAAERLSVQVLEFKLLPHTRPGSR